MTLAPEPLAPLLWLLRLLLTPLRRLLRPRVHQCVLVGLPYSHFVEIARWSLALSGRRFTEVKMPIGPAVVVAAVYRLLFRGGLSSSSSFPGDPDLLSKPARRRDFVLHFGGLRRLSSVPLIVFEDRVIPDSWSAITFAGLTVDAETMVRLDKVIGPRVRQLAYFYIFEENMDLYEKVQSCSPMMMRLFRLNEWLFDTTKLMRRMMDMSNETVKAAEDVIFAEFDRVGSLLERHAYLGDGSGGDAFGGADLAFSALVGWLLLPPNFHAGAVNVPEVDEMPSNCQRLLRQLRDTRAGKHVVHCYQKYRVPVYGVGELRPEDYRST